MRIPVRCRQRFLTAALILVLLASGPTALLAQEPNPTTGETIYLPLIQGGAPGADSVETDEDETPAVTDVEIEPGDSDEAAPGVMSRTLPAALAARQLARPARASDVLARFKIDQTLLGAAGKKRVIVRLSAPSVAEVMAAEVSASSAQAQLALVQTQQAGVIQAASNLDPSVTLLGVAQKALNAVMLEVDATVLRQLAADPAVISIKPIVNYEMALSETVPYIGATAVHEAGFTGSGVAVAVLDSGIDYTHAALGGSGDPAEYAANDPTVIEAGTFPTAKVIGGADFVGSQWDGSPTSPPEMPDPDPLDDGPEAGHGTHVADIIAGGLGVAPGASLYAVKVCSSVSTFCSGVALIQAMDFALDPNGDGDISDHVGVINMSLGSNYGTAFDDNLSQAVENASKVGVLTVASAGNGADKPYVAGTPANAPSALSVAETNVPSAIQPLMEVVAPASIAGSYPAVFQPWSTPLSAVLEGPLQYGDGAGGNLLGCAPFDAGSLAGKLVLVDRGACNFTLKISNISVAGGLAGIIGLVAPGDPFSGGDGGDRPIDIPGYMISQAVANMLKSELATGVTLRFDPAVGLPLVGHMVGSSSRGPSMGTNIIKPEIGAPGASVSAIAGTGAGVGPFGGTSGAAPMVSGAAALLRQAYPNRSPAEIKAVLMNTAETAIFNIHIALGGDLAPITRIGGGEVRVDRALAAPAAAWNLREPTTALSFVFHEVTRRTQTFDHKVLVRNYSDHDVRFEIGHTFRFASDSESGAVEVITPRQVRVRAHRSAWFPVVLKVDGEKLQDWGLNSGSAGASGNVLTAFEYDGYVTLTEVGNPANQLHLPWHILPRKAGDVTVKKSGRRIEVRNRGIGNTLVESYSLIARNGNLPEGGPGENNPTPDFRYLGYSTFPVPADFCSDVASFVLAFAVNTYERQTHANAPLEIDILLDTDQDGVDDYVVFTFDASLSGAISDGRNLTWVANLTTGEATAFFFTDHQTNSGNTVMLICGEQIGMNAANLGQPINLTAQAVDWYYGQGVTDAFTGITIAPGGERYIGVFENGGVGATLLEGKSRDRLQVVRQDDSPNNTERGLLLLYRNGEKGKEAATIRIRK